MHTSTPIRIAMHREGESPRQSVNPPPSTDTGGTLFCTRGGRSGDGTKPRPAPHHPGGCLLYTSDAADDM
eukprot:194840-Rhodomonas_salina.1